MPNELIVYIYFLANIMDKFVIKKQCRPQDSFFLSKIYLLIDPPKKNPGVATGS